MPGTLNISALSNVDHFSCVCLLNLTQRPSFSFFVTSCNNPIAEMLPSIGIQSMPESIPSGMPRMSSMTVLPKSMPCGHARHVNLAEHGKRANNGCSPRVLNYVMTVSPRVKITLYRTGILCLQLVGFPKTYVQKPVGCLKFCPPLCQITC